MALDWRWNKKHLVVLLTLQMFFGVVQLTLNAAITIAYPYRLKSIVYIMWIYIAATFLSVPLQALLYGTGNLNPALMIAWYILWVLSWVVNISLFFVFNSFAYSYSKSCGTFDPQSSQYDSSPTAADLAFICTRDRLGISLLAFSFIMLILALWTSIYSCVQTHRSSVERAVRIQAAYNSYSTHPTPQYNFTGMSTAQIVRQSPNVQQPRQTMQQPVPMAAVGGQSPAIRTEYFTPTVASGIIVQPGADQVKEYYNPVSPAPEGTALVRRSTGFNPNQPFVHNGVVYKAVPVMGPLQSSRQVQRMPSRLRNPTAPATSSSETAVLPVLTSTGVSAASGSPNLSGPSRPMSMAKKLPNLPPLTTGIVSDHSQSPGQAVSPVSPISARSLNRDDHSTLYSKPDQVGKEPGDKGKRAGP